ncbi:hypothetical protein F53441_8679 [Fusarium austroafricanum]|uniref:NACHT domain-containing protein n=1 Tax=Fusarium austroafricanum TaxID=2364996 RepID=A0A8H4NWA1_9HYPO|nr:hypothetical protein F53441_8679 [Fusarium austroafricanum]
MDPVSAFGLAAGVLAFVEAGLKLLKFAHGIHTSSDGVLDDNRRREIIANEVNDATIRLEITGNSTLTPEQQSLSNLAKKCHSTSSELLTVLDQVKPKPGSKHVLKSMRYGLTATGKAKKISELESQLKKYQDQLTFGLVELSRIEAANGFNKLFAQTKNNEAQLESLTQSFNLLRRGNLTMPGGQGCVYYQQLLTVDEQVRCAIYQDYILRCLEFEDMQARFEAIHDAHEETFSWIYEPINIAGSGFNSPGSDSESLRKLPDLTEDTFADLWTQVKEAPWKAQNKVEICGMSVKNALKRLLQNPRLYNEHRLCIFIDGLDEFEPGLQDGLDYRDLVVTIRQWTKYARGSLKLCVSSREEGVFMNEYKNDPGFRLQDLTKFDMQAYIRSRLSEPMNDELKRRFIEEIPERSSGIFLWTYLVVNTIRNKVSHQASDEMLLRHLETLPLGLKALFEHVLQNLEPVDVVKTLRMINLLQVAKANGVEFTLLASSLLEEFEKDPDFSMRNNIDELREERHILRAQLRGACGGLIESHRHSWRKETDYLDFVHRSVPDIFHKDGGAPELSRRLEAALTKTDTIDVLSHVEFASLRLSVDPQEDEYHVICKSLAIMRLRNKTDKPPYHFLDYMSAFVDDSLLDRLRPIAFMVLDDSDDFGLSYFKTGTNRTLMYELPYNHTLFAIITSHGDYIKWKIQNDPGAVDSSMKRALIGQALLLSEHWEIFFENSVFTLDSHIPLRPYLHGQDEPENDSCATDLVPLTAWQFFLVRAIFFSESDTNDDKPIKDIMERFLKEGADPYCQIQIALCLVDP